MFGSGVGGDGGGWQREHGARRMQSVHTGTATQTHKISVRRRQRAPALAPAQAWHGGHGVISPGVCHLQDHQLSDGWSSPPSRADQRGDEVGSKSGHSHAPQPAAQRLGASTR